MNKITLNGVEYVEAAPAGNRCVVVIDRGWIFAGDVVRENGRIRISRALWVFKWESIGFDGVIKNPWDSKVTLKPISDVDIPERAEIFCVPVHDNWGL
jgi:hypothetical protein